ncbi:putative U4/U6.U5 tri-snRNP-associated protein [Penaeus vannamei]|uniref:Putative U4/U6.U5 tri-snRNP-associated protein n=1 Tax=Penaeus vannamei TaxID=6689 RepID=A0A423SE13_PENVA|nr:putative U4/U6.U5 tri-snRNP-associated protein [Penaeus vannamei]
MILFYFLTIGRGPNTHAYTHSVSDGHHVYLNLQTLRFYCLPDNYEIIDSSLNDIIYVVNPTFTKEYIAKKVNQSKMSRAYDGTLYLPGIVGLNNIKANDYCNVVLQALSNITPLRNYFLDPNNYSHIHHAPGTKDWQCFLSLQDLVNWLGSYGTQGISRLMFLLMKCYKQ